MVVTPDDFARIARDLQFVADNMRMGDAARAAIRRNVVDLERLIGCLQLEADRKNDRERFAQKHRLI